MSVGESFLYQGSKHIFSKILGAVSNKLQQRFFPLDVKKFLVEYKASSSSLHIDFDNNTARFYLSLNIINHTAYELLLLGLNLRVSIGNFRKEVDKLIFNELLSDSTQLLNIEIPLTFFEAKQMASNHYHNSQASIELNYTFHCHTKFGLRKFELKQYESISAVVNKL